MAKKGQAKAHVAKLPAKKPKAGAVTTSAGETPFFCFRHADRATKEPWAFRPSDTHAPALFEFLCEMSQLKWSDIERQETGGKKRHRKHHAQGIDTLSTKAQADLRKRKLDETFGDEIFRFRLGSKHRLWGFRVSRVFHVVWWDPDHRVYPTETE